MGRLKDMKLYELCVTAFFNIAQVPGNRPALMQSKAIPAILQVLKNDEYLKDKGESFMIPLTTNACAAIGKLAQAGYENQDDDSIFAKLTELGTVEVMVQVVKNLATLELDIKKQAISPQLPNVPIQALQFLSFYGNNAKTMNKLKLQPVLEQLISKSSNKQAAVQAGKLLQLIVAEDDGSSSGGDSAAAAADSQATADAAAASSTAADSKYDQWLDLLKAGADPDKQYNALGYLWSIANKNEVRVALRDKEAMQMCLEIVRTSEYAENLEQATGLMCELLRDNTAAQIAEVRGAVMILSRPLRIRDELRLINHTIICYGTLMVIAPNAKQQILDSKIYQHFVNILMEAKERGINTSEEPKNQQERMNREINDENMLYLSQIITSLATNPMARTVLYEMGVVDVLGETIHSYPSEAVRLEACSALWNLQNDESIQAHVEEKGYLTDMLSMLNKIDLTRTSDLAALREMGVDEEVLRKASEDSVKNIDMEDLDKQIEKLRKMYDDLNDSDDIYMSSASGSTGAYSEEDGTGGDDELMPSDDPDEAAHQQHGTGEDLAPEEDPDDVKPAAEDDGELKPAEDPDDEVKPAEEDPDEQPAATGTNKGTTDDGGELQPAEDPDELKPAEDPDDEEEEEENNKKNRYKRKSIIVVQERSNTSGSSSDDSAAADKRKSITGVSQLTLDRKQMNAMQRKSVTINTAPVLSKEELQKKREEEKAKKQAEKEQSAKKYDKRKRLTEELLETEKSYVQALAIVNEVFMIPLKSTHKHLLNDTQFSQIFSDIEVVHKVNAAFLEALEKLFEKPEFYDNVERELGLLFSTRAATFKQYTKYVNHYENADAVMHQCIKSNRKFAEFLDNCGLDLTAKKFRQSDLGSFLIMPIQRLPRYNLLLSDILKSSDLKQTAVGYTMLQKAILAIIQITNYVNETKRDVENKQKVAEMAKKLGKKELITPDRLMRKILKDFQYIQYPKGTNVRTAPVKGKLYVCNDIAVLTPSSLKLVKKSFLFPAASLKVRQKAADKDKEGKCFLLYDAKDQAMEYEFIFPEKSNRDEIYHLLLNMNAKS